MPDTHLFLFSYFCPFETKISCFGTLNSEVDFVGGLEVENVWGYCKGTLFCLMENILYFY